MVSILLSMAGLFISETLVYLFSRKFASEKTTQLLEDKYPDLKVLLEAYNYKFLALGMICPAAPTDVICFLSAKNRVKVFCIHVNCIDFKYSYGAIVQLCRYQFQ
ncbi:hypothetical protein QNN00_00345 [Bacillus velezensis]|nr:hypothetical protein [Bacillus velezensis]